MKPVSQALTALGITEWILNGEPTTESEFNVCFKKVIGVDDNDSSIISSNPSDFGVTWSQITVKQKELQTAYENNAYQRNRANEYPEIKEQLDLLYKDMLSDKGDKTGAWFAAVKAVKDKYSKE